MAENKPDYRFKFQIVDEATGDVIADDWCTLTTIDEFGGCEAVDHQVASTLRYFTRTGRAKHEAENHGKRESYVTQTAAQLRAVAKEDVT